MARVRKLDPLCDDCGERCSKRGTTRFSFQTTMGQTLWRCQACLYAREMGRTIEITRAEEANPMAARYLGK